MVSLMTFTWIFNAGYHYCSIMNQPNELTNYCFLDSYDEARIHLKDSEKGSDWSDQEQMSTNSRLRRRDNFVPGLSTNVSHCHAPKKRRTDQQPIPPVPPASLINNSFVFPAPMNTATLVGVTYHENVS